MGYLVVVTGSRDWTDLPLVYRILSEIAMDAVFMQGGCDTGADLFARMYCEKTQRPMYTEHANWELYKLAAGPKRNRKMLSYKPDLVIGFRKNQLSKGTKDCVLEAERLGIQTMRFGYWDDIKISKP